MVWYIYRFIKPLESKGKKIKTWYTKQAQSYAQLLISYLKNYFTFHDELQALSVLRVLQILPVQYLIFIAQKHF